MQTSCKDKSSEGGGCSFIIYILIVLSDVLNHLSACNCNRKIISLSEEYFFNIEVCFMYCKDNVVMWRGNSNNIVLQKIFRVTRGSK